MELPASRAVAKSPRRAKTARQAPAAAVVAESESRDAQFRSFAEHSANLLWIADPATGVIEYRSPAYEQIWGEPRDQAAGDLDAWLAHLHPEDVARARRALRSVANGEVVRVEYRIVRPGDGAVRWLRDTSFPIRDPSGRVVRVAGITEDLTRGGSPQVYIVGAAPGEARRLGRLMRALGLRARTFPTAQGFLDMAPFLAPGAVLADLRTARRDMVSIALELRARSAPLKTIMIGPDDGDVAMAVEAMKLGAADYLPAPVTEAVLAEALASLSADTHGLAEETRGVEAAARVARLSAREREVLTGLVEGGTNKTIALRLAISPRTVELHRGQIMAKLGADSLAGLLQLALTAGLRPAARRS